MERMFAKVNRMRHWLALLTSLFVLLVMAQARLTYASAGEVGFVDHRFSATKIFQGDSNLYVNLTITNSGDDLIKVHGASVNLDWQEDSDNSFKVGTLLGGAPYDLQREIATSEFYTLTIFFNVQQNVSVENHFYEFRVFFDSLNGTIWTRDKIATSFSPNQQLNIHSMFEKTYSNLLAAVEVKFDAAEGAGFISPEAKSLLAKANQNIADSVDYKDQGEWQIAVGLLQGASEYINQSYGAEQTFRTFVLVGTIIGVAAVVVAVVFLRKKGKNRTSSAAVQKLLA
jgi:hypothetical protein